MIYDHPRTNEPQDDLQVAGDVALDAARRVLESRGHKVRAIVVSLVTVEPVEPDGRDACLAATLHEDVAESDESAELVAVLERNLRAVRHTA